MSRKNQDIHSSLIVRLTSPTHSISCFQYYTSAPIHDLTRPYWQSEYHARCSHTPTHLPVGWGCWYACICFSNHMKVGILRAQSGTQDMFNSRIQAGHGRRVKKQQGQMSPNNVHAIMGCLVLQVTYMQWTSIPVTKTSLKMGV